MVNKAQMSLIILFTSDESSSVGPQIEKNLTDMPITQLSEVKFYHFQFLMLTLFSPSPA